MYLSYLKKFIFVFVFMVSIINQNVFAANTQQKLITFTNDKDKTKVELYINYSRSSNNFNHFFLKYSNGDPTMKIYQSDLVRGKTILTKNDADIIEIFAKNFDEETGGIIELEYVKFYRRTTDVLHLELAKNGNTWLLKYNDKQVSSAKIISNLFWGKTVGIAKFELK